MKHLKPYQHEHGIGPLFDRMLERRKLVGPDFYPAAPGYKRDGTSKDAAEEMEAKASVLRIKCMWSFQQGPQTADEIAAYWHKSVLAIRPRISELVARGKIEDSGIRRRNVSGKSAIVWRLYEDRNQDRQ